MRPYLIRHLGRELQVPPEDFFIGRAVDCQLLLNGGLVSRHHARLRYSDAGLVVEDLGSRNGVLVNQQKISGPVLVGHGDIIGIGLERLEVVDPQILHHPEHLSTLPPAPPNEPSSDVGDEEIVTVTAGLDVLTEREREVLDLIVRGHTQREMAQRLHISVKTIETHRARLADKLGCRTRAELVTYAISAGLLRGK